MIVSFTGYNKMRSL